MRILVYGSLNLDYVYKVHHIVRPGETQSSESLEVNCGGKGLNQAVALARAGCEVYLAGAIGADGEMLREALEANRVDTRHLLVNSQVRTGNAIIQVDAGGQNSILLFGGANRAIPEAHIDRVLADFRPGDYLVLQNEVNGNGYIMEQAHEKGMKIVLNPSPADSGLNRLPMEYVDWFLLNEVECAAICGGSAEKLTEAYPNAGVVLTLGEKGSVCCWKGRRDTCGIYETRVVDTTAAGDTFSGYFLASLTGGKPIGEALRFAAKASSLAVSRPGAQPSIPYPQEVEAYGGAYIPFRGE